jgi:hypothetical protein
MFEDKFYIRIVDLQAQPFNKLVRFWYFTNDSAEVHVIKAVSSLNVCVIFVTAVTIPKPAILFHSGLHGL